MAGRPIGPLWSVLVMVDNNGFNCSNENVSKATENMLNVIDVTDSICLQLGLHVSLIGTEIWNQGNFTNVQQDVSQLLDNFNEWKVFIFIPTCHVILNMFVDKDFSNIFRLAWISGICYPHFGPAVYKFHKEKLISFILHWVIILRCHNLFM